MFGKITTELKAKILLASRAKNTKGQIHCVFVKPSPQRLFLTQNYFENICSAVLDWLLNTCSIVEILERLPSDKTQN